MPMENRRSLPRHLVEFLGNKDSIMSHMAEYAKTATANEISSVATKTLVDVIVPFYESKNIYLSLDNVAWFIREPLKNANFYSGNDEPIRFGVHLSEKGLIASYNDGGDYFKNQNVKRSWENRQFYHEKHTPRIPGTGIGLGTSHIYHKADIIYVDTTEGTLYVGLGINKIVEK